MTAVAVRQREAVKVDARQASFQFVRNVLQVSFSVIFYLRSKGKKELQNSCSCSFAISTTKKRHFS
jgi:hypothetical protein